jgi:hypothetical protein
VGRVRSTRSRRTHSSASRLWWFRPRQIEHHPIESTSSTRVRCVCILTFSRSAVHPRYRVRDITDTPPTIGSFPDSDQRTLAARLRGRLFRWMGDHTRPLATQRSPFVTDVHYVLRTLRRSGHVVAAVLAEPTNHARRGRRYSYRDLIVKEDVNTPLMSHAQRRKFGRADCGKTIRGKALSWRQ